VVSPSQTEDYAPVNNNNTPPLVTDNNIKDVLFSLATSETQAQAIKAMMMLADSMSTGTNAQEVFDLQGVTTIVYGILCYSSSKAMLIFGLGALVNMTSTFSNDKVGETLQRLDFMDKISSLASIHNTYMVSSFGVGLLCNLAINTGNQESLLQLGSEGIVKFLVTTMATYPEDYFVTEE
jgi:hypothetical protein